MVKSPQKVYEKGYLDGLCTAENRRWHRTPIGDQTGATKYHPDESYREAYDEGFQQGLKDAPKLEDLFKVMRDRQAV